MDARLGNKIHCRCGPDGTDYLGGQFHEVVPPERPGDDRLDDKGSWSLSFGTL
jgi:hypothetical protein